MTLVEGKGPAQVIYEAALEIIRERCEVGHLEAEPQPSQPADIAMRTEGLSAWYDRRPNAAIRDINLPFVRHKVTALLGPNGCGKSTLLRCLNLTHTNQNGNKVEGAVYLEGENIYDRNIYEILVRATVGMVFQTANPFPMMNLVDNVVAGLKLQKDPRIKSREGKMAVAEYYLQRVGLWDEVKHKLNVSGAALSGGQQQRLCIARAIAIEPKILLMDESTSNLDPTSTRIIHELMDQLKSDYTLVMVTHNFRYAARASDYTAFIDNSDSITEVHQQGMPGRLVEYGPTAKVFVNPQHPLTEAYITGRFG